MLFYVLRRLPSAVIVLFVASIIIFFVLRLAPGDPAVALAGPDADESVLEAIRTQLGLNQPLPIQYGIWVGGILSGNLGDSYLLQTPVAALIGDAFANTLVLSGAAVLLAVVGGGIIGMVLGISRGRISRALVGGLNSLAFAVPTYVTGVLAILLFAVTLRLLPSGGNGPGLEDPAGMIQYLLLPAFTLSLPTGATLARFLATSMRQALDEDFVQTAIAKGLSSRRTVFRHALPNALSPVLTVLGIQIGQLLGGAIIVETIFAWPGIGQLLVQAVIGRDYVLTQDILLLAVLLFVVIQIITDLIEAAMDPRVRLGAK